MLDKYEIYACNISKYSVSNIQSINFSNSNQELKCTMADLICENGFLRAMLNHENMTGLPLKSIGTTFDFVLFSKGVGIIRVNFCLYHAYSFAS